MQVLAINVTYHNIYLVKVNRNANNDYTYYNATYRLGLLYYKGFGVEKDLRKGIRFIKEASDYGITDATNDLNIFNNNE